MASHTVENYLKTIYQAHVARGAAEALVPMGQLAAALGVVPGTATTMVKALAEAGLVHYEPYGGVRLTPAGDRLAALVLRRHRLVEQFLVQVLGMSWAEVHDEAEHLEHAVSDRLIARIDDMLGHPSVDPHGDPIPGPEGTVTAPRGETLLSCPLRTPVRVVRVVDQDAAFLRFVEQNGLKPGEVVEIDARDPAADSVRVRRGGGDLIALGARAASKLLVGAVALLAMLWAGSAAAQGAGPAAPFEILDNSFLVEEAFNQEAGVFQNIVAGVRVGEAWQLAFTQEWPLGSQAHQVSYTLPLEGMSSATGLGDVQLHYRYQAVVEGPGRPAFSPRLTVIVPSGAADRGLGSGSHGLQVNLPFSKQTGDVYWHWNGGVTWLPSVDSGGDGRVIDEVSLVTPHLSASAIWRARPLLHLMVESVLERTEQVTGPLTTARYTLVTVAPGARAAWNLDDRQVVVGVAIPVVAGGGAVHAGLFGYLSYELPFAR